MPVVVYAGNFSTAPQLSRPVKVANEFTESSIWSINPQTRELTRMDIYLKLMLRLTNTQSQ